MSLARCPALRIEKRDGLFRRGQHADRVEIDRDAEMPRPMRSGQAAIAVPSARKDVLVDEIGHAGRAKLETMDQFDVVKRS